MNLRSGPGTSYAIIGGGDAGDTFPITGRIRTATGPAWIYGPYAQSAGRVADVAVVAAPPAPTTAHQRP